MFLLEGVYCLFQALKHLGDTMHAVRKFIKETVKAKLEGTKHSYHMVYSRVVVSMQLDHGMDIYSTPEAQLEALASQLTDDYLAAR